MGVFHGNCRALLCGPVGCGSKSGSSDAQDITNNDPNSAAANPVNLQIMGSV
jgi:hypothetical protein